MISGKYAQLTKTPLQATAELEAGVFQAFEGPPKEASTSSKALS